MQRLMCLGKMLVVNIFIIFSEKLYQQWKGNTLQPSYVFVKVQIISKTVKML